MAYQTVDFGSRQRALQQQYDQADRLNALDPGFDATVMRELNTLVNASMDIINDYFGQLETNHRVAKQTIGELEELVKRGTKLQPGDLKVIETMERTIQRCDQTMTRVNNEGAIAVNEFRQSWESHWRPLLSDPKKVEPAMAKRQKWIDDLQQKNGLTQRVHQYVKRAAELKKTAEQLATKGAAAQGQEAAEIARFTSDVQAGVNSLKGAIANCQSGLTMFSTLNPKQKKSAPELKLLQDGMKKAQGKSKEVRGSLKTLDMRIAGFKKLAGQFGDATHRKSAAKALGDAVKAYKEQESAAKKLEANEAKVIKLIETIAKLK